MPLKNPEADFTNLDYLRNKAKVEPYKIEKLDLEKIRNNGVIEPDKQIAPAHWTPPTEAPPSAPQANR